MASENNDNSTLVSKLEIKKIKNIFYIIDLNIEIETKTLEDKKNLSLKFWKRKDKKNVHFMQTSKSYIYHISFKNIYFLSRDHFIIFLNFTSFLKKHVMVPQHPHTFFSYKREIFFLCLFIISFYDFASFLFYFANKQMISFINTIANKTALNI